MGSEQGGESRVEWDVLVDSAMHHDGGLAFVMLKTMSDGMGRSVILAGRVCTPPSRPNRKELPTVL